MKRIVADGDVVSWGIAEGLWRKNNTDVMLGRLKDGGRLTIYSLDGWKLLANPVDSGTYPDGDVTPLCLFTETELLRKLG